MRPTFGHEVLRAGAEEINDVHMAADVDHDLELGAQSLQLGAVGARLRHLHGHHGARLPRPEVDGRGAVHEPEGARPQKLV